MPNLWRRHERCRAVAADTMKAPTAPNPQADLLTPDETARRLRITRRTLYTWLRAGTFPGARIGGVWRIKASDVELKLKT